MDLKNLNTFIQVAELNSFTRAAEKLGYAQPTVSFQIKQLEDELGVQLFERIGHTVSLTDHGRNALTHAQHICRIGDEMIHTKASTQTPKGKIRLAMADSLCRPLVVEKLGEFWRLYPKIDLQVTTAGTGELFRLLDHNEADIVCTLDSHIYNATYVISHEEKVGVHFVCSAQSPLAGEKKLSLQRLLKEPFLLTERGMSYRRLLDEYLAGSSLEILPMLELGNADLLCRLVENGTGVSFLPDYVTEEAARRGTLCRLQLPEPEIGLWKQILYHRNKWLSPQMQAVLDFLSQITLA